MNTVLSSARPRDLRLDFFRGLVLLIIFIAHVFQNWLADYMPSRFGLSDAAEIFIFVSGYAAAFAYGKSFQQAGFWIGTARVLQRCVQLYGAHLGLFFSLAVLCVVSNRSFPGVDYLARLEFYFFFEHPQDALLGLFTLHYVPHLLDILPMYIVALALLPGFILLARLQVWLMMSASFALYLAVPLFGLELPAEMIYERPWFFNPFAWQFLFYTGFALSMGWVKAPPKSGWLMLICALFLLATLPFSPYSYHAPDTVLGLISQYLAPFSNKTNLGILRWLHFLALAYLVLSLLKGHEAYLGQRWAAPLVTTGRQALPVFWVGTLLSFLAGVALDQLGRGTGMVWLVNLTGIALLLALAYLLAWMKTQPWKRAVTSQINRLSADYAD